MRPVDRVASLEPDDAPPAALGEEAARVGGVLVQLGEAGLEPLEDRHRAGEVRALLRVELRNAGVLAVRRSEALLRLALLVVGVDLLDVEDGQRPAVLVGERDAVALRRLGDGEADGKRPGQPAREPHGLDDAVVVLLAHEAGEGRERAGGEHVEVGQLAGGQRDDLERVDVAGALARPRYERAAVRRDELVRGDGAHARTSEPTRPSSSSFWTTIRALSSGDCASVSTTISGLSGAS